jgi:hypothetical protein
MLELDAMLRLLLEQSGLLLHTRALLVELHLVRVRVRVRVRVSFRGPPAKY